HNTTAEKTPFYLTYGREATLPIDLKIPSQISQKQAKQKQVYDQQGISEKLKIGDQFLVKRM
ncbi:hypothetical protein RhiirA5_432625, partial [Rhizophagus irregularis]